MRPPRLSAVVEENGGKGETVREGKGGESERGEPPPLAHAPAEAECSGRGEWGERRDNERGERGSQWKERREN
ncbi:hypothetical protein M8J76_016577 [Diaphorina citri]|nr:hypothetical protein M8J75_009295 [Diaphorina citri]KAI5722989.1 hypothetical protein M8J76_016577 [Diaphorina citri]